MSYEKNLTALNELKKWKRREDQDNGFSKNIPMDAYRVLDNNYEAIVSCLQYMVDTNKPHGENCGCTNCT